MSHVLSISLSQNRYAIPTDVAVQTGTGSLFFAKKQDQDASYI